ncbi:MAG: DUF1839 family protein [Gemmatimonadaceae bacterium]
MTRVQAIQGLESEGYLRHTLHADHRLWVEKNCYVDVCIEFLHALKLEPLAMLGSCAAVDFEGDNVTFYKPSHDDIRELYGVDIQELNVWRPLIEHVQEHLAAGKLLSTEADAYHLPDTEGTDYRRNHVKTTIVAADIDLSARRLGYFHNAGYHTLSGDDFTHLFRLDAEPDPTFLPLFAELVRIDRAVPRPSHELGHMALALLRKHVARRPERNPWQAFAARFERDLPGLQARGLAYYHAWAFATARQIGATSELLAEHLRWLQGVTVGLQLSDAAAHFDRISQGAKTFILKAARSINTGKAFGPSTLCQEMADAWDQGMLVLTAQVASDTAASVA